MDDLTLGPELGAGAVATVYRIDGPAGRSFAGKVLHSSRQDDPQAAIRFAREAQVVAEVDHPNVVRVFGRTPVEGRDVLLMELVPGPTLEAEIARGAPFAASRLISIAKGIAAGLVAAHEAGVIHRDLKPANVLLTRDDVPKIADFGMARASSFAGVDAGTFAVLGTPDYMAPESLEPLAVDARSDLYALGCIMFEMGMGRPPFSGATSFGVIEHHRTAPVPSMVDSAMGPGLIDLVTRLLDKNPPDRPQSASAVLFALQTLEGGGAVAKASSSVLTAAGRCVRCQAPLVEGLRLCLSCRMAVPRIEAGDHTVFVTGPGEVADKMDSQLRADLVAWLRDNPTLGVDATGLERAIPRLPFALLSGLDPAAAQGLVESLQALGLQAETAKGGPLALPGVRKKSRVMAARVFTIVIGSTVAMSGSIAEHLWVWLLFAGLWLTIPAGVVALSLRPKARAKQLSAALPPPLALRMENVATVGAGLESPRHREALRGVVSRVLALRETTAQTERDTGAVDEEAVAAIDLAIVATGRLDILDQTLKTADLNEATDEVHGLMRERDTWSARLLDLVATLEALRTRVAAAAARGGAAADDELLDALRAKVEALEEVQQG